MPVSLFARAYQAYWPYDEENPAQGRQSMGPVWIEAKSLASCFSWAQPPITVRLESVPESMRNLLAQ